MNLKEYIEDVYSQLTENASEHFKSQHITYGYKSELITEHIEFFKRCAGKSLSAYKALLFFDDYLKGNYIFEKDIMIQENFIHLEDIEDIKFTDDYVNMVDLSVDDDESFILSNGIVSHNSAMGSILQKRNTQYDAVYALKGKIKNARRLGDLSSNSEIIDLMNILGIEPENDRSCKYERVIISADADPDGLGHIASLVINLFHRWFPNVIRQGRLFILQTPLLSVEDNKKRKYFFTMKEFEHYSITKKPSSVRYLKGLGSLSREDWESVFSNMKLMKITEDSKSHKMIDIAFGSNASLRKKWLQS